MATTPHDPWHRLRAQTPARLAIGRAGSALPTREVLEFSMAHARARDAVHAEFDRAWLADELALFGLKTIPVESQAADRSVYLRRPDLGRRLDAASQTRLRSVAAAGATSLTLVIADGLSAAAVHANVLQLVRALLAYKAELKFEHVPVVLAKQARVALGDEIGGVIGTELVAVVIGERPGLSSAENLSIYLTYKPGLGKNDSERNCISNIGHGRLAPKAAAANLAWLVGAARERQLTGVGLKDESSISSLLPHQES